MSKFEEVIKPLEECGVSFKEQRMILHEMFASAMMNVPENETDNFTAKRLSPVYLAFCELLENIRKHRK